MKATIILSFKICNMLHTVLSISKNNTAQFTKYPLYDTVFADVFNIVIPVTVSPAVTYKPTGTQVCGPDTSW